MRFTHLLAEFLLFRSGYNAQGGHLLFFALGRRSFLEPALWRSSRRWIPRYRRLVQVKRYFSRAVEDSQQRWVRPRRKVMPASGQGCFSADRGKFFFVLGIERVEWTCWPQYNHVSEIGAFGITAEPLSDLTQSVRVPGTSRTLVLIAIFMTECQRIIRLGQETYAYTRRRGYFATSGGCCEFSRCCARPIEQNILSFAF